MPNHDHSLKQVLIDRIFPMRQQRMARDRETMRRDRVELWLEGLESDQFQQCTYLLEGVDDETGKVTNCAIGVGIRVYLKQVGRIVEDIQYGAMEHANASRWYGIEQMDLVLSHENAGDLAVTVTGLNDLLQLSFTQIAQQIRKDYF